MTDPVMLLSQVHGEGRVTFRALRAAGFYTLAGVAQSSLHLLSERAHLSVQTARRLKSGAEEMLDRGIGAPTQDDQPKPAPSRGRPDRGPRFATKPPSITFSTGVSIEEALLLSQAWETRPEPFFTEAGKREPAPAPPLTPIPVTGPRIPEMAAAAEVAASLVRVPIAGRPTAPAEPALEKRTEDRPAGAEKTVGRVDEMFWSFG